MIRLYLMLLVLSCAGPHRAGRGRPLRSPSTSAISATGLRVAQTLASRALTYQVALSPRGKDLISVELETSFLLVHRRLAPGGWRVVNRVHVGPAERDIHDVDIDFLTSSVWVVGNELYAKELDFRTGKRLRRFPVGGVATAILRSPEGDYIVTGMADGVLCLRRSRDLALLHCVDSHTAGITDLAFSRRTKHGLYLISTDASGRAQLWRFPSLHKDAAVDLGVAINGLAVARDGNTVAFATSRRPPKRSYRPALYHDPAEIHLWTIGTSTRRVMCCHVGPVASVAWTANDTAIVSASWDRTVALWDVRLRRRIASIQGYVGTVVDIAADPQGRGVAVASWASARKGASTQWIDLLYSDAN